MKPPYLKSKDLICCCDVFGSHEDFSVAVNIYAGFDVDFNPSAGPVVIRLK